MEYWSQWSIGSPVETEVLKEVGVQGSLALMLCPRRRLVPWAEVKAVILFAEAPE